MKRFLRRAAAQLKKLGDFAVGQLAMFALWLLGRLPTDAAINFAGWMARTFGPLSGRDRVALYNLRRAYPEKTEAEIRKIASDMWENMGRLAAEYVYIGDLFDYDPRTHSGKRIEVTGDEIFLRIAAEQKPHIIFTGHLGNFELLPIVGDSFGMPVTSLFRAPNNRYIANYIFRTRADKMGGLLASRAGASIQLARIVEAGGNIGMLVDQRFIRGVRTTFFGQNCETSPLLPKLARQFECDVYPAHCRRLPGNRYHLTLEDKLVFPRDADGRIDVAASTQMLNDVVERWVREDPAQWMWFHKRWRIYKRRARG